jgi:uncharacterized protein
VALLSAACAAAASTPSAAQTTPPSFDCSGVPSPVEALICRDLELTRLDRLTWAAYDALLRRAGPAAIPEQELLRGVWLVERNSCAFADDTRTCVRGSYLRRIAWIREQSSLLSAPQWIPWACNDDRRVTLYTTFDNESYPPSVALTYGNDQAAATLQSSYRHAYRGVRYAAPGIELQDRGRDVLVTWRGKRLICRR